MRIRLFLLLFTVYTFEMILAGIMGALDITMIVFYIATIICGIPVVYFDSRKTLKAWYKELSKLNKEKIHERNI